MLEKSVKNKQARKKNPFFPFLECREEIRAKGGNLARVFTRNDEESGEFEDVRNENGEI